MVAFIASPLEDNEKNLVTLAKKLKKNEVAVDLVNIGQPQNLSKLQAFIEAVNKEDNSHLVDIPCGLSVCDILVSSPVVGGNQNFGFDDPNMDPEIAEAIRLSLEEEKQRQEKEKQQ